MPSFVLEPLITGMSATAAGDKWRDAFACWENCDQHVQSIIEREGKEREEGKEKRTNKRVEHNK